ncbi:MAG TPA: SPFH domain-containing protein [Phototrophicaceae bacterium]|nr:SPFH domain-containing protein [Phototrophicaceae bacterium]
MSLNDLLLPILLIAVMLLASVRYVSEHERAVVFVSGKYEATRGPGWFWVMPLVSKIKRVDIRPITIEIEPQTLSTRDNNSTRMSAVLEFHIDHPEYALTKVSDYHQAMIQITITGLNEMAKEQTLDELYQSPANAAAKVRQKLEKPATSWGIKIDRIEIKTIDL